MAQFTDEAELAALKAGNIAPLLAAKPRPAGSRFYAKLTLKYSAKCGDFFTIKLENVEVKAEKSGKPKVDSTALTADLVLPGGMRELVERFAELKPAAVAPASTSSAA